MTVHIKACLTLLPNIVQSQLLLSILLHKQADKLQQGKHRVSAVSSRATLELWMLQSDLPLACWSLCLHQLRLKASHR